MLSLVGMGKRVLIGMGYYHVVELVSLQKKSLWGIDIGDTQHSIMLSRGGNDLIILQLFT